jgi:ABC-type dipeptide/oligopeptide/nickel transport system permease subunit
LRGLAAIPGILLAIALMAALGASVTNVSVVLILVYVPSMARIARASALQVPASPFLEALAPQGSGPTRLLWLQVAPNALGPVLVQAAFIFSESILAGAALSFLVLGRFSQPRLGRHAPGRKGRHRRGLVADGLPGFLFDLVGAGLAAVGGRIEGFWDLGEFGGS